jgi:hypothetical protein
MEFPRLSIQPFTEAAGFLDTDELAGWLGVSHMVFAGGFTPVFARAAALELGYAPEAIWGDEWLNFSIFQLTEPALGLGEQKLLVLLRQRRAFYELRAKIVARGSLFGADDA